MWLTAGVYGVCVVLAIWSLICGECGVKTYVKVADEKQVSSEVAERGAIWGLVRRCGVGRQFGSPFCQSPIRQALTLNGETATNAHYSTSASSDDPSFEKVQDATIMPATT